MVDNEEIRLEKLLLENVNMEKFSVESRKFTLRTGGLKCARNVPCFGCARVGKRCAAQREAFVPEFSPRHVSVSGVYRLGMDDHCSTIA